MEDLSYSCEVHYVVWLFSILVFLIREKFLFQLFIIETHLLAVFH